MSVSQQENEKGTRVSEKNKDKTNQRRKLLLGVGASSAIAVWQKPVINSLIIPAHAQTSMLAPEDLCPMITIGNVVTGPVSGSNTPPVCSITFDVLSGTAGTPLTITGIDPGTLPANTTFTIDSLGTATDVSGPRVVWRGPATDAPFCTNIALIEDVSFTVTATCVAAGGGTFSQDFTVSGLV